MKGSGKSSGRAVSGKPIIKELDFKGALDRVGEIEVILGALEEVKKIRGIEEFLFRGIKVQNFRSVGGHGTDMPDQKTTFCSTEEELGGSFESSALEFFLHEEADADIRRALLVYDASKLESAIGTGQYEYGLKEGVASFRDALVAILKRKERKKRK